MRASLLGLCFTAGLWLAAGAAGCGDDETRTSTGVLVTTVSGSGVTTGTGMGGAGAGGGDIPDTPCESPAEAAVEVYPAGSSLGLDQLVSVGDRWRAAGFAGSVTFDRDGGNADAMPYVLGTGIFHSIRAEGADAVGYAASGSSYVGYQRFGPTDPLIGIRSLSTDETNGVTSGLAGPDTVVVWGRAGALYGQAVLASGTPGADDFVVASGAYTTRLQLMAVNGDAAVNVFWNGSSVAGVNQSQVITVDADGTVGTLNVFYTSNGPHDLVQVRAIADGFVALIVDDDGGAKLFRLDGFGNVVSTSPALAGVSLVYDLAVSGDRVAVAAARTTGEPQMRIFDLDFAPQSPWVCFAANHNNGTEAAVSPDGTGWAMLFEANDGAAVLGRVDASGTGAP